MKSTQPFEQPFKAMLNDILLKEVLKDAEESNVSNKSIPDSIKVMIDYMVGGYSHEFLSYLIEGFKTNSEKPSPMVMA